MYQITVKVEEKEPITCCFKSYDEALIFKSKLLNCENEIAISEINHLPLQFKYDISLGCA